MLPQTSLKRCNTVTVAADDSTSHLTPVVLLMPRRDDSVMCDSREFVNNTKSFDLVHLSSSSLFLKHQQLLIARCLSFASMHMQMEGSDSYLRQESAILMSFGITWSCHVFFLPPRSHKAILNTALIVLNHYNSPPCLIRPKGSNAEHFRGATRESHQGTR